MQTRKLCLLLSALYGASIALAQADVRLPAVFSDNMVLQQRMKVPVWGWADDGEEVTVSFRGKSKRTVAKDGKWSVQLSAMKAGGPDTLVVAGKNRIELENVLVGEVWICSGQSNMEWPLSRSFEPNADIAASKNPQIRLFQVPKTKADAPREDTTAQWKEAHPETIPGFSAVAYYFGRELQKYRNVPVGLIQTCWGGSPAEVWMSETALAANPEYQKDILDAYSLALRNAEAGNAKKPNWKPTELYNGMIAPLIPYGIKGVIWYQGESNAGRAQQYRSLFPDMITNWRQDWNRGDFDFLFVQLAPWDKNRKRPIEEITAAPVESDWAELREAQLLTTRVLDNTGMAVITDLGDKDDIHPLRKREVGERLALAARGIAYGERVEHSGPVFKKMRVKDGQAVLSFDHAKSGLKCDGDKLRGFAICGQDGKFVWADARITGKRVVVSSPQVPDPVAVRYGWSDYPVVNLYNNAGLPATPFRTDDFLMVTRKKQD